MGKHPTTQFPKRRKREECSFVFGLYLNAELKALANTATPTPAPAEDHISAASRRRLKYWELDKMKLLLLATVLTKQVHGKKKKNICTVL